MFFAFCKGFLKMGQGREHWTQSPQLGVGKLFHFTSLSIAPFHLLQNEE